MQKPAFLLALALAAALPAFARADAQTDALAKAQALVAPEDRTEVLFVQGRGTPAHIEKWNYFFYDADAKNRLRHVEVVNGQAVVDSASDASHPVRSDLVFDPARAVALDPALKAADAYAQQNAITYDRVRVLLRRPAAGQAPCWRVELLQGDLSRGVIHTGPAGEFVRYAPAGSAGSGTTAAGFFNDVQNTFKGIGGDLQEFFTSDRTVDQ